MAAAVVALAALCLGRAAEAAEPRILVVPFAVNADPGAPTGPGSVLWLGEASAILVTDALEAHGLAVVTREERVAAFDRLQLPLDSPLTHATIVRVGELLGAGAVVFGEVRAGTNLDVTAKIVQLDLGRELAPIADEGALPDLFTLFSRIGERLGAETGRPMASPAVTAPSLTVDAFENLAKGLVAGTPVAQQHFLEAALKEAPHDGRILLSLAAVYSAEGSAEKALAAETAVPADSRYSRRAQFAAALSLVDLHRFDGAFRDLTTLAASRPSAAVANALGVVQMRRGAPAGSSPPATYFRQAADLDPGNPIYLFNLGYAYALAHDETGALTWLRNAVRYDVTMGDAHLVMSAVLAAAGRSAEASRELDLARDLGAVVGPDAPSDRVPTSLERLTTSLDAAPQEQLEQAIDRPAQQAQQQTASYYLSQGRTLANAGRDRDAVTALRHAVYLSPYDDEPHVLLGRVYERGGRLTDAVDEFKVALWCRETATAHAALAGALLESGDREGARREAARALVLDPQSDEAKAVLKRLGSPPE